MTLTLASVAAWALPLLFAVATPATEDASPQPVPTVDNVFTDLTPVEILVEIGYETGETLIPDSSVPDTRLSIEFLQTPLPEALDRIALMSGLVWKEVNDTYLVSSGEPGSPMFFEFAESKRYVPQHLNAQVLNQLMPDSVRAYTSIDPEENVIGITAAPNRLAQVENLIRQLDRPGRQIVVEALVTEISTAEAEESGFSWSWGEFLGASSGEFTYGTASPADFLNLQALIRDGHAEVRANPRVAALEGKSATLTVGKDTYFTLESGNAGYRYSDLELIRTGITLTFIATISDDDEVTLQLQPEVSDAVVTVNGNPTTNVRKVETTVRVKDGETIALGGLIQDSTHRERSKVPILGDLPLIGGAFRSSREVRSQREVIILITPRIIRE